jgi:type II secretory pathway pseudopilin PulG
MITRFAISDASVEVLMSGRRNAAKTAISLVELLVVIGIIAILIAMLLPSISRAREQANRTRCENNIRQIGLALAVYVSDHGEYPVLDATGVFGPPQESIQDSPKDPAKNAPPVFAAARRSGLLALRSQVEFRLANLACPDGWASGGDRYYYDDPAMIRSGTVFMDYAYWPWRFPPTEDFDVRFATFKYRQEKGTKILVTDIVTDFTGMPANVRSMLGYGNHGSNHTAAAQTIRRTDGHGQLTGDRNTVHSSGMSVLFSDYHVDWYSTDKLTQQVNGLCYPPVDKW